MARRHRQQPVGISLNNTVSLEQKLVREITSLKRQLESVKLRENTVDFCMLQTYKEMIHSRQVLLNGLPRRT